MLVLGLGLGLKAKFCGLGLDLAIGWPWPWDCGLGLGQKFKAKISADYNVHHELPSTRVNYISRSTFLTYLPALPRPPMAVRDSTVPASFPTGMALALALISWPWP